MNTQSLDGNWKGEFTYGDGYEIETQGKSVKFEMILKFNGNIFTGTCIDEETKHLFKEPATIEGIFDKNYISIIKKYPCLITANEENEMVAIPDKASLQIHYTGTLRKRGLFFGYFFEGEWEVTTPIEDEEGEILYATGLGSWTMTR
jgi:hypothetical protein